MQLANDKPRKPDFLIIGAQKSATTWLWNMLKSHPGAGLPDTKEIHYFGSAEMYRKGPEWYYAHFANIDSSKVTGEASTTYLFDRVPFWYNEDNHIKFDDSLPPLPQLVTEELPNAKILVMLRDPVSRAISAYHHWMREHHFSPLKGVARAAKEHPKTRILEYGYYARYLKVWKRYVPPERLRVLIFEEDVIKTPQQTLRDVYSFLDLDPEFVPPRQERRANKSWGWTRIVYSYYLRDFARSRTGQRIGNAFDKHDFLKRFAVRDSDKEFFREQYMPEKQELEAMLGRSLDCWRYGQ